MPTAEHSIPKPEENAAAPKWMFLIQLIYLVLLIVIISAAGTTPSRNPANNAIFYLVAFLTGYREDLLRELLKRASDSLFASAKRSENGKD